jgi:Protein of unknown function (DUF3828)
MRGSIAGYCLCGIALAAGVSSCKKGAQDPNRAATPQTSSTPVPVASTSPDEASCHAFVQEFYDWYVKAEATPAVRDRSFSLAKARPRAISASLGKLLNADYRASKANPGEIVGLDFDPFLNSQDPSEKFAVQTVSVKDGKCTAVVRGLRSGAMDEKVNPELDQKGGAWEFINFHYPGADPKDGGDMDLISILKNLSEERHKPHK